jgi:hypothetical protein
VDTVKDSFNTVIERLQRAWTWFNTQRHYLAFKLEQILPKWLLKFLHHTFLFTLKTLAYIATQAWLGILAYQAAYTVFCILGFVSPAQAKLFRLPMPKDEEVAKMKDSEEKRNVLGKKACDAAIQRGGAWVWALSAVYLTARLILRPNSQGFIPTLLWSLAGSFALFNLLPVIAAGVVRIVVPEAYLAEWLFANEEVDERRARKVLEKARARKEREIGTDKAETERWEERRVGYSKRVAGRRTGGLRVGWEL